MAVKKSIAIIGEGETEWWYFDTLRIACRYKFKVAPDFPQHSDIPHMAKLAEEYVKRDTDYVVCLVDMDRLLRVPTEMATYQKLKKKSSRNVISLLQLQSYRKHPKPPNILKEIFVKISHNSDHFLLMLLMYWSSPKIEPANRNDWAT